MENTDRIDIRAVFDRHPFARRILTRLAEAGHEAVLIGGVVRDGVLAAWGELRTFPPDDVDIATSAMPEEIRALFADRPIVGVGEEFGVLVVVAPDGVGYEVATFRVEEEYDGRWPHRVELVRDLAGDVARRDFTINGLAARLDGRVIDLVGGISDLRGHLVRAIGKPEKRFAEDHLRMLRAVRFVCQIDGRLDPCTAAAATANAERLSGISWERIRDELLRVLSTVRASEGLALMDELGLLSHVLPELVKEKGVPQPEEYHPEGDVFVHTLMAMRVADSFVRDPIVKLAVLLHDIGKPEALERNAGANMGGHCALGARQVRQVAQRLRLSRAESSRLTHLVRHHMRIADLPEMGLGKQVRFLTEGEALGEVALARRYPLFFDLLQLLVADCEASAHRSSGWGPILRQTLRIADHVERVGDLQRARSLIDGHDLLELGESPGRRLGEILATLHDRILAGEIGTREEALAAARRLIESK
jgi:poly(A) polymerase